MSVTQRGASASQQGAGPSPVLPRTPPACKSQSSAAGMFSGRWNNNRTSAKEGRFPLHGTIPPQGRHRAQEGHLPTVPPDLLRALPLPLCTTRPMLGRDKTEWGKNGSGGDRSCCLNQRLCHVPAGSGLPCVLMELRGAHMPRHHASPQPTRTHAAHAIVSVPFCCSVRQWDRSSSEPRQIPASRCGWRLCRQPGALSLSRPGALSNLPTPKRQIGCTSDRYHRVGKPKGHCAALCKVKYICTAPWAAFLGGWKDKQDFLQELETMGG